MASDPPDEPVAGWTYLANVVTVEDEDDHTIAEYVEIGLVRNLELVSGPFRIPATPVFVWGLIDVLARLAHTKHWAPPTGSPSGKVM